MYGYGNSMFLATHGILARGGGVAPSLLLDTYTNAAVAYSLRKLRTAYSGSAIRVRRSSDNAEQDIGFSGNDLDTTSLLTFCGVGNGFVTTWYDQSGNANNSTQATAANQAQVVLNGNLVLDPNTNKISTNWTGDHYQFTTGISPNTKYFLLNVLNRSTGAIFSIGNGTYTGSNGQFPFFWNSSGGGSSFFYCMPTIRNPAANTSTGAFIVTSEKNNTNQQRVYFNGVTTGTVFADAPASGSDLIYFGRSGTNTTTARFNEMIYWNSEQSANRTGIETNVNTYWNVY